VAFRFVLRLVDGGDGGRHGRVPTGPPDWKIGDTFYDRERKRWRIVRILDDPEREPQPGDVDGLFIVEPA
jgi:hypothetical protein